MFLLNIWASISLLNEKDKTQDKNQKQNHLSPLLWFWTHNHQPRTLISLFQTWRYLLNKNIKATLFTLLKTSIKSFITPKKKSFHIICVTRSLIVSGFGFNHFLCSLFEYRICHHIFWWKRFSQKYFSIKQLQLRHLLKEKKVIALKMFLKLNGL